MTGLTGTGQLTKLAGRRDIALLPVSVWGTVAVLALVARDLRLLYPTAAKRLAVARTGGENAALRFLFGRLNGTSIGALTAWRFSVWAAAFAAMVTILIVIRHTRADEEAGRLELVGSAACPDVAHHENAAHDGFDGTVTAFNAATGAQEWSTPTNNFSGEPVATKGTVWVDGSAGVYAMPCSSA